VSIPFKCLMRADQVTAQVAAALKAARCRTVWIGAESGSQRILDAMEKGIRVDQIAQATKWLREAGIEVGYFLQFGYPGETLDDIGQTLRMVRDNMPDDIGVSVSYPLPGTSFYERVKTQLGAKQNWLDSNDLAVMYRATYAPPFYRALHALVHADFRARRSGDVLKRVFFALKRLALQRRVQRLARVSPPRPPLVVLPMLTPQAAAVPSEQPH
jgi:radical SAM superfamily enzyme YgiQ (UPF0313 family)